MRCAEDAIAARLDVPREPERGLAAELRHDADRSLPVEYREHLLRGERLEVEAVGGVVVRRDGLRVAVDHHGFVAEPAKRLHGVHAAVVELDPLADAIRARAEDHDARCVARRRHLVVLAPGRVEVVRSRLDLAAARVDAPVRGPDPACVPGAPYVVARRPPRGADRVVAPARTLRTADVAGAELPLRRLEL